MTGVENELIRANDEIYAVFGVPATLTRKTDGTYDPATGTVSDPSTATSNLTVLLGERAQQIDNGAIIVIQTVEARQELTQGDQISVNSSKFNVTAVHPEAPFGNVISWIADVEGYAS